jgi:hypothetical protein
MSFIATITPARCPTCGRRRNRRRLARAAMPAPLLEWGERQPKPPVPISKSSIRDFLAEAAQARRCGDHTAAHVAEVAALLAMRGTHQREPRA